MKPAKNFSFRSALKNNFLSLPLVGALTWVAALNSAQGAPITPGDIVVYRVGNGLGALGTTATPVFLDEYNLLGALVQSLPLPTTGLSALTAVGNATTEGIMSRSQDGSRLVFTGYRADAGSVNPSGVAPGTVNRVIGTLPLTGSFDTSVALTDPTGTIRSATSTDGSSLFYIGTSTSVRYVPTPSGAATTVQIDLRNSRQALLSGNTLYAANGSTAITGKVQSYGTLPTGATIAAPIVTLGTPDAVNGIAFFDLNPGVAGDDTLYALSTVESLLRKYTFDGSTWTASGSITSSAANLTGSAAGSAVNLFLTSGSTLSSVSDLSGYGGTLAGTITPLATAGVNTAFRGVSMFTVAVPEPSTWCIGLLAAGTLALRRRRA